MFDLPLHLHDCSTVSSSCSFSIADHKSLFAIFFVSLIRPDIDYGSEDCLCKLRMLLHMPI